MRLIVTRPAEDSAPVADLLRRRGITPVVEPVLTIEHLAGSEPELNGVQAILVTSANGVRALAGRTRRRDVAVYAVGEASAATAREAGFVSVESAGGDTQTLAALVQKRLAPKAGVLAHVAGTRVAGDLKGLLEGAGFIYRRINLYAAWPSPELSPATVAAVKTGAIDGVLFFSPRSAAAFVELARKARIVRACAGLTALCLSPAVAEAARALSWRHIATAAHPDMDAMMDQVDAYQRAPDHRDRD